MSDKMIVVSKSDSRAEVILHFAHENGKTESVTKHLQKKWNEEKGQEFWSDNAGKHYSIK